MQQMDLAVTAQYVMRSLSTTPVLVFAYTLWHTAQMAKGRQPNVISADLVLSHVDIDKQGCWIWRGSPQTNGYGQIKIAGRSMVAHRVSWIAHRGAIPEGLGVLHRCDVRRCCNPAHLFLGTAADNMRDAGSKGRLSGPREAKRARVQKLTDEMVREIRSSSEKAAVLAARFGVGRPAIYNIRNGVRKWLVE